MFSILFIKYLLILSFNVLFVECEKRRNLTYENQFRTIENPIWQWSTLLKSWQIQEFCKKYVDEFVSFGVEPFIYGPGTLDYIHEGVDPSLPKKVGFIFCTCIFPDQHIEIFEFVQTADPKCIYEARTDYHKKEVYIYDEKCGFFNHINKETSFSQEATQSQIAVQTSFAPSPGPLAPPVYYGPTGPAIASSGLLQQSRYLYPPPPPPPPPPTQAIIQQPGYPYPPPLPPATYFPPTTTNFPPPNFPPTTNNPIPQIMSHLASYVPQGGHISQILSHVTGYTTHAPQSAPSYSYYSPPPLPPTPGYVYHYPTSTQLTPYHHHTMPPPPVVTYPYPYNTYSYHPPYTYSPTHSVHTGYEEYSPDQFQQSNVDSCPEGE